MIDAVEFAIDWMSMVTKYQKVSVGTYGWQNDHMSRDTTVIFCRLSASISLH